MKIEVKQKSVACTIDFILLCSFFFIFSLNQRRSDQQNGTNIHLRQCSYYMLSTYIL